MLAGQSSLITMASKRELETDFSGPPSKCQKTSTTSRNFKDSWKIGNDWLSYDPKSKIMTCKICIKTQRNNIFTSGCSVLKKENVTKHSKSKDHVLATSLQKQGTEMQKATQTAHSKSEKAITTAMTNVYFAAKQNLPNSVVPKLNDLMLLQGLTHLADLQVDRHTSYSHPSSIHDFQTAISTVLQDQLLKKITESGKFTLMFDESTDISVHQNLIVYVRILEPDSLGYFSPNTYFLGIDSLVKADSVSIYEKVKVMLSEKGISLDGLCGVSTDGAAVMVGNKSGVVTRLKRDVPGVLATHCIAHRLALSCCSGADSIPYLVKVQEILNSVYKYFSQSPKNMALLESVQSLFSGQSSRFKQVFHTRWLSFEGSVDAMVKNYSGLISVFLEEKSGKALSMHKSISCYKFLYVVHFLSDVLKPIAILSKVYQKSTIDFSEVMPMLESTISTLLELQQSKNGQGLTSFLDKVPSEPTLDSDGLFTFEFGGHTIRDSCKQRSEAVSICDQFVFGMVQSLKDRFGENSDTLVLTSLSNFFNPGLEVSDKTSDVESISDYLASVGMAGYRDELLNFARFAFQCKSGGNKSISSTRDMANLALKYKDVYPATAEVATRFLIAPVSTVDCERGFSKQNLIKTCLRNSMSVKLLESLLRITIDGPDVDRFDFKQAFKVWAGAKARRILN